jgi:hypothetical protein
MDRYWGRSLLVPARIFDNGLYIGFRGTLMRFDTLLGNDRERTASSK